MSDIRLILLDFDGTIVDTRRANCLAYVETLREAGYPMSEEEYAARYFGVRCPEFLRSIGIGDPEEIDRLRRRKIELYPRYFDLIALNRPLWEFCQQFRAQGGRVWIVSTGQRANIDHVMHHLHHRRGNPRRNAHLRGFARRDRSSTAKRCALFCRKTLGNRRLRLIIRYLRQTER